MWRWLSLESWGERYLAGDPRVTERPAELQTHPGLHKSYVQVMAMLAHQTAQGAQKPASDAQKKPDDAEKK